MSTIINLLSGPRNVSTALMYSFAERSDTAVVDEPLYGHYLKLTRAPQPHRDELLCVLNQDGDAVIRDVILSPPDDKPSRQVPAPWKAPVAPFCADAVPIHRDDDPWGRDLPLEAQLTTISLN